MRAQLSILQNIVSERQPQTQIRGNGEGVDPLIGLRALTMAEWKEWNHRVGSSKKFADAAVRISLCSPCGAHLS